MESIFSFTQLQALLLILLFSKQTCLYFPWLCLNQVIIILTNGFHSWKNSLYIQSTSQSLAIYPSYTTKIASLSTSLNGLVSVLFRLSLNDINYSYLLKGRNPYQTYTVLWSNDFPMIFLLVTVSLLILKLLIFFSPLYPVCYHFCPILQHELLTLYGLFLNLNILSWFWSCISNYLL